MESDFINVINDLMRKKESDLTARLACQEETLDELTCTDPRFGKWFEEDTVQYVLSAFDLSDEDFASVFPPLKHISAAERQNIIRAFNEHIERCPRCFRKRSFDLEFEARLDSALQENRDDLLASLVYTAADEPCEEEHAIAAADERSNEEQVIDGKARFAHHS